MKKLGQFAIASSLAFTAAACSEETKAPESGKVTETQMDDVDVIDGTISDEMIDVDTQASADQLATKEGEDTGESDGEGKEAAATEKAETKTAESAKEEATE